MTKEISFLSHLEQLRYRLIFCIGVILVTAVCSYSLVPCILEKLAKPFGQLIFTTPGEAFLANINLSVILGIYFSSPLIFYQIWVFIATALTAHERKNILGLVIASVLLFHLGLFFCYFIVIPVAIKFLLSYGSYYIRPMISLGSYFSFLFTLLLSFGLTFQFPLIIYFLIRIGVLSTQTLIIYRRLAIVMIVIAAAIITPSIDAFTQIIIAIPLILLYEISIIGSKFFKRR